MKSAKKLNLDKEEKDKEEQRKHGTNEKKVLGKANVELVMKKLTEEAQLVDKQSDCKKLAASNTVNNDKKIF